MSQGGGGMREGNNERWSEGDRDLQVEAAHCGVSTHCMCIIMWQGVKVKGGEATLHMICGLLSDSFSQRRRHPRVG